MASLVTLEGILEVISEVISIMGTIHDVTTSTGGGDDVVRMRLV